MIARPTVSQVSTASGTMVFQTKPEDSSSNCDIVSYQIPSGSSGAPVGFIQVPSGAKQPIQFVQLSQASTQAALPTQNIYRIASTSSTDTQTSPSYVRLASTGQIVQIGQAPNTVAFKPQTTGAGQSVAGTLTSTANQVNLVQLQGLPGEQISYIPLPPGMKPMGNFFKIQSPINSTAPLGTLVQVASPTRQQAPVQRLVQVQQSPRAPGVVLQPQRPQMVQMSIQRPAVAATNSASRPTLVPIQGINANKPQTSVVQVYATPRMQTTMTPSTRPMVQVRPQDAGKTTPTMRPRLIVPTNSAPRPNVSSPTGILQSALRQATPRPMATSPRQRPVVRSVGTVATSPRADGASAATTVIQNRPQGVVRVQGPVRAQTSPIRQVLRASNPAVQTSPKPISAQVVQVR